jgi:D-alanine-D-alanine ligase
MNDHRDTGSPLPTAAQAISLRDKRLGLVFDEPSPLDASSGFPFPDDATAEWETRQTVDRVARAWSSLGMEVVLLPLDSRFWGMWEKNYSRLDLVHSLVEGWGSPSREAWLPAVCELSGVPCVGSPALAQGLAMRKSLLKILCRELGVPTADFHVARTPEECEGIPERLATGPCFLKPDCEGSGMGVDASVSLSDDAARTRVRARSLLSRYPDGVIIEALLPGEELTTALIGSPLRMLPPARIEVDGGVYGIANKSKETFGEKVTFPSLAPREARLLEEWSTRLCAAAGFTDFVRLDWKRDAQGVVTFMEANPLAGLSHYYSVLPKIAAHAGLPYEDLLAVLGRSALSRSDDRSLWYGRARMRRR